MKVTVSSGVGLGVPQEYDVEPGETVGSLRQKVAAAQAIEPDQIQLVRNGQALDPNTTIKEAGIKNGETIKAMPNHAKGGA